MGIASASRRSVTAVRKVRMIVSMVRFDQHHDAGIFTRTRRRAKRPLVRHSGGCARERETMDLIPNMSETLQFMLTNKIALTASNYVEIQYMGSKRLRDLEGEEIIDVNEFRAEVRRYRRKQKSRP
jgi:hypothetical protein